MVALLTRSAFIDKHMALLGSLHAYAWTARGRRYLSDAAIAALTLRSSTDFPAMNVFARIAIAKAGAPLIRRLARRTKPVLFLTLTPGQFAVPVAETSSFDPQPLADWVSERLAQVNYLGMIDVGYFSNYSINVRAGTLALHAHVLAWGASNRQFGELIDGLNTSWLSLIPGSKTAVGRPVGQQGAESRWWYLAKAPITESRVVMGQEVVDPTTGEITPRTRIRDRPLRPRDAARLSQVLVDQDIAGLFVAGGRGRGLRRRILDTAEREMRTAQAAELTRLHQLLGEPSVGG